jgi:hypothetical protein
LRNDGTADHSSAIAPATGGVAMDVPLKVDEIEAAAHGRTNEDSGRA